MADLIIPGVVTFLPTLALTAAINGKVYHNIELVDSFISLPFYMLALEEYTLILLKPFTGLGLGELKPHASYKKKKKVHYR